MTDRAEDIAKGKGAPAGNGAGVWPFAAVLFGAVGAVALAWWLSSGPGVDVPRRVPLDHPGRDATGRLAGAGDNPGTLVPAAAAPSSHPGSWPQFRGADRSNIAPPAERLAASWPDGGPRELWRIRLGEGYAGAAVHNGRVYLMDYDAEKQEDALRCLSLDTGEEIWRFTYSVRIKRNHGMSRTVPAVHDRFVVGFGPMCHVICLDAETGELIWQLDLVEEFGTTVPPWYAGQCPLIDGDRVVLAPGADPLMMAVSGVEGGPKVLWETPNPGGWGMSHTSIAPMTLHGVEQYVYVSTSGAVGVDAEDGAVLWEAPGWRVPVTAIASPVQVGDDRVFFAGGYGAGAAMYAVERESDGFSARELWHVGPRVFGATQHTPVLYEGHIYGIAPNGEIVCLDLDGKRVWSSGTGARFELGPFLVADGKILALDGANGILRMADATPDGFNLRAEAKVIDGHECWGPMALAGGRLILRNMHEMVCLEVGRFGE